MKEYLGDGVYVDVEGTMIKLMTENGVETTNAVYLEPEVWSALDSYVNRFRASPLAPPIWRRRR